MEAVGIKVEQVRKPVRIGAVLLAAGRWWLKGWLEFTTVVAGGPEFLTGPRPSAHKGGEVNDA